VLSNLLNSGNIGGASAPRATATSSARVHAPPQATLGKWGVLVRLPPFFLPLPTVTSNVTYKANKTQQTDDFVRF